MSRHTRTSTSTTTTTTTTLPQWKEAVAGAAAGAFSRTVVAPIERVKLLKQLQGSVDFAANQSAWQVAVNVYRQQGPLAFWRGNLPNVLRVSGTAAINFTCMDYYKNALPFLEQRVGTQHAPQQQRRRRQMLSSFVAGGLAGGTSTTLLYPIEFARTRLAMDVSKADNRVYKGMKELFARILKSDGVLGFYQGYGIAVFGGIFYRVLYLGGYDVLKDELQHRKQKAAINRGNTSVGGGADGASDGGLSWGERIACAQTISLVAGTLSYPLDSVRRRLMMQAGVPRSERRYRNSVHCFATVARNEGVRGFFLGLGPNLVRSVGGALILVGYDVVKSVLR